MFIIYEKCIQYIIVLVAKKIMALCKHTIESEFPESQS